ncbi:MAG: hypothetical protein HZA10_06145 [Nitrospirae bacterium]|nr:hypothetical protein [Nitrospirota bacterium]
MFNKNSELVKIVILIEIIIILTALPYLSGRYAYAPKEVLYTGTFASSGQVHEAMTLRNQYGQRDFFDQERIFLRFYRESILKGDLPFWNERTFGGVSQEDSMIYSYLSPFHLPWLVISDDHIAKGVQIFLLLNYGMLGFLFWCRTLQISPVWTFMVMIFGLFTPLSLHFYAHTHQPGILYSGLYITLAYYLYLQHRNPFYLSLLFIFLSLSIITNFLSVLLFISLFLVVISVAFVLHSTIPRKERVSRIARGVACYSSAVLFCSFFLGPILLESYLVREPVAPSYSSYAPWNNLNAVISSLSVFGLGNNAYVPFLFILPILLYLSLLKNFPVGIIAMIYFWVAAFLITSFEGLQAIFRSVMPGMKYSNNALFRMLFFANLFGFILIAWLSEYFKNNKEKAGKNFMKIILLVLAVVLLANAVYWSVSVLQMLSPELVRALPGKLPEFAGLIHNHEERFFTTGLGLLISIFFFSFWRLNVYSSSSKNTSRAQLLLVLLIGIGYLLIYQFQRPDLLSKYDVLRHPIFSGIEIKNRDKALTLEDCGSAGHQWYRNEATLAGFSTFDGPTDTGIFTEMRCFWAPLNDIEELNKKGVNLMEVNWICSEKVISEKDSSMVISAKSLFRALGVKYLFTDREINDIGAKKIKQTSGLRLYELGEPWPDITYFPGADSRFLKETIQGLARGSQKAVYDFLVLDRLKRKLNFSRSSNIRWEVSAPPDLRGTGGALFMNHPLEYHRNISFPLTNIPAEGRWEVVKENKSRVDFPLSNGPFRIVDIDMTEKAVIQYSLRHYWGWTVISACGFIIFIVIMIFEKRKTENVY